MHGLHTKVLLLFRFRSRECAADRCHELAAGAGLPPRATRIFEPRGSTQKTWSRSWDRRKTESLSGYRLGVAFGSTAVTARMGKLQAIVSLRAAGYCQAVLRTWFDELGNWMEVRIRRHQAIRDDLVSVLRELRRARPSAARWLGSYLFPRLPQLSIPHRDFVKALRVQANVTVTPGLEFSPHATCSSVRLNFSQDHNSALDALARLKQLAERYRN